MKQPDCHIDADQFTEFAEWLMEDDFVLNANAWGDFTIYRDNKFYGAGALCFADPDYPKGKVPLYLSSGRYPERGPVLTVTLDNC